MTAAPAPSPAEQAVIDRFEAAEEPEEIRAIGAMLDVAEGLDRSLAVLDLSEAFDRGVAFAYEDAADRIRAALDSVR